MAELAESHRDLAETKAAGGALTKYQFRLSVNIEQSFYCSRALATATVSAMQSAIEAERERKPA